MKKAPQLSFLVLMIGLVASASGQSVSFTGEDANIGAGWRDSTVTKAYSVNGSNVYGLDGYYTPASTADTNTAITNSLPSYVSSVTNAFPGTGVFSGAGYEAIDNPTTSSPYFNGLAYSGTVYLNGAGPGVENPLYTFTLAGTVPADIRVGVMLDNTDNSDGITSESLIIYQSGGGPTASTAIGPTNQVADWYFFDITGATAGEVFDVAEQNTSAVNNQNLEAGLISFDTVVPEPSTYALIGLGSLGMFFVLRRKRAGLVA